MRVVDAVAAVDEATSWSSQYFVQTMSRMADSSRAKVKEVLLVIINFLLTIVLLIVGKENKHIVNNLSYVITPPR